MLIFKNCFDKARVRNSIKLFSDPQLCSDFSEYLQYGNTDIQERPQNFQILFKRFNIFRIKWVFSYPPGSLLRILPVTIPLRKVKFSDLHRQCFEFESWFFSLDPDRNIFLSPDPAPDRQKTSFNPFQHLQPNIQIKTALHAVLNFEKFEFLKNYYECRFCMQFSLSRKFLLKLFLLVWRFKASQAEFLPRACPALTTKKLYRT